MWKFLVKNQKIEVLEREVIASHQIAYVKLKFTFDGDWKKFHKVVQFTQCDETYCMVLGYDGTTCYLPPELHVGAVKMSVFGYDTESDTTVRATTVPVTLNIRPSGFVGDDEPPIPPTPDLYTQLLQKMAEAEKGADGKSAYEIAVEQGFVGTEAEWLESLKGKDGEAPDMSDYPKTSEVTTIIEREIAPVADEAHTHDNKATLDTITEDMLEAVSDYGQFEGWTKAQIQALQEEISGFSGEEHTHENKDILDATTAAFTTEEQTKLAGITPDSYATKEALAAEALSIREAMIPLERKLHSHQNKAVLDTITAGMLEAVSDYGAFEDWTKEQIHTLNESVSNFSNTAHTHENKEVLDGITTAKMAEWDSISTLKTQVNGLSTELTVYKDKSVKNATAIDALEKEMANVLLTLESLQAQIDSLRPYDTSVTLFHYGDDAMADYGEVIYTFYNDGYRSLSGFVESYPNFCCAENDYALSYNHTDFSWAGELYTISTTPVQITHSKSIMFSYQSGAADTGELYLVPKPEDEKSAPEMARYVYQQISSGSATTIGFKWLQSDSYITTLHSCKNVTPGEYLLAWKGVSDNTHPLIRSIKILEV